MTTIHVLVDDETVESYDDATARTEDFGALIITVANNPVAVYNRNQWKTVKFSE